MNPILADFVRAMLLPTLVGKSFAFYFGLKYSENPGEGYGWGLLISILFTFGNLARFVWKYRDVEDP